MRRTAALGALLFAVLSCDPRTKNNTAEMGTLTEPERWTRRLKCHELGLAREQAAEAKAVEVEQRDPGNSYFVLRPEYCFSKTLNTCIYEEITAPSLRSSGRLQRMSVIDLITDNFLADVTLNLGQAENENQRRAEAEYKRKRDELFRGCAK